MVNFFSSLKGAPPLYPALNQEDNEYPANNSPVTKTPDNKKQPTTSVSVHPVITYYSSFKLLLSNLTLNLNGVVLKYFLN